ncbi:H-NS family nucleoid-associated regulatory protein [Tropicimonas sp. IMCC34011]|uniref:H-NS histone family protein n=1 Tax=Tropicimonas sp. IMCC34011 TaxID=2248759 RepID=UPI000E241187|nr:H-NS histone family protein [Tropicimonas sp. IMCC34011]
MAVNIEGRSRKELEEMRAQIDAEMEKALERDRREALDAVEKTAQKYGWTLDELIGGRKKGKAATAKKSRPKYAHPENPSMTWTGRGRRPQWIKDHEDNGGDLNDLAI